MRSGHDRPESAVTLTGIRKKRIYENAVVIGQLYRYCYQHPKAELFDRYGRSGIERLRTDVSGALTMRFGVDLSVREYRRTHPQYWHGG